MHLLDLGHDDVVVVVDFVVAAPVEEDVVDAAPVTMWSSPAALGSYWPPPVPRLHAAPLRSETSIRMETSISRQSTDNLLTIRVEI